MGTPHAGTGVASLGSVIANVASSFLVISKRNLMHLREGSESLQELSVTFGHLQKKRQEQGKAIEIITFTESLKTRIGLNYVLVSLRPLLFKFK
jgi:hypothetical protein